ncbi:MAG: methyl-accepting chemotaxis protein, partial [Planctomycetota bacterium]
MKIRTQLILAIAIPLVVLSVFAGRTISHSLRVVEEMEDIEQLTLFATKASALVHETQKERGATAGFLGSTDGSFDTRVKNQREATDVKLAEFETFIRTFDFAAFGRDYANQISLAREQLDLLDTKRKQVSSRSLPTPQAIGYYTKLNGLLLDAVGKSAMVTSDGELALRITAYTAFLQSKERAGIERAVLTNTFARDAFGEGMYEKFTSLVALQDSFLATFLNIAVDEDRTFYVDSAKATAFEQVENYRSIAVQQSDAGDFGQDAGEWFDTITKKINVLKSVDDHIANGLLAASGSEASKAKATLTTVAVTTAVFVLFVAVIGWMTVRSIVKRLAAVTARVRDIAEDDADLTVRLPVDRDEIGELSGWFNALLERIEKVVIEITNTSIALSGSAGQLVETADTLKSGADDSKSQSSTIS